MKKFFNIRARSDTNTAVQLQLEISDLDSRGIVLSM